MKIVLPPFKLLDFNSIFDLLYLVQICYCNGSKIQF